MGEVVMNRGPFARNLEELNDLERQNLEAGTMGEAYSPPSNTMEAINRVAVRPDDSRSSDELAAAPAVSEQHTDAKGIAKSMEPKKSQREMLADWLKEQDAMLKGLSSERARAISDAERASAGSDQGRSIINSLAAGGSILAGNKDLAKGYMAQAGEMPGAEKAAADRKALAAWVKEQAGVVDSRGKLMQQAGEADERNAYLREALASKPPPKEPTVDPLADKKGALIDAKIAEIKKGKPAQKAQPAQAKPFSQGGPLDEVQKQKEVDEYGRGIGGFIPEINSRLRAVESQIPERGDVAGVGFLDSRPNWMFQSSKNIRMKQDLEALKNLLLRKESGAAISNEEQKLKELELGLNPSAGEVAFRLGIKALKDQLAAKIASEQARFHPESIAEFDRRRAAASGQTAVPQKAKPKTEDKEGDERSMPDGRVMVFRGGEWVWK